MEQQLLKKQAVDNVLNFFTDYPSVIIADYSFLDAEGVFKLKKILNKTGSFITVRTNNVIKRSFKMKDFLFSDDIFSGMNCLVFLKDTMKGLKDVNTFCKENNNFKIKAGVIDGKKMLRDEIIEIALLPSKEESISKIVLSLKKPLFCVFSAINKKNENEKDRVV